MSIAKPEHASIKSLEPLPYPIYVVHRDVHEWPELIQSASLPTDLFPVLKRCVSGSHIWGIETYIFLKQRGLDVHLVQACVPGHICLVPYHDLLVRERPFNSYIVACRVDSARPEICEQQTVLNELCVQRPTDHFMIQWSQTYLIPRNPERGDRLSSLVFKGSQNNLADPFKDPEFYQQLENLGIEFGSIPDLPRPELYDHWRDYSEADAVLAIRWMAIDDFKIRPPTKLLKAWLAGCPALLDPEPSFRALRQSELDYFEIHSPQDAIAALRRLKEELGLYSAMVQNGLERAKEFTEDNLSVAWRTFFHDIIIPDYQQWLKQSWVQKRIGRPIQYLMRAIRHKKSLATYTRQRNSSRKTYGFE